eukprot:902256-Pelagomonas_calceolata.AAC.3
MRHLNWETHTPGMHHPHTADAYIWRGFCCGTVLLKRNVLLCVTRIYWVRCFLHKDCKCLPYQPWRAMDTTQ